MSSYNCLSMCVVKGVSTRSVEQQIPAANSSNLAAALLDSQPRVNPDPNRVKGESFDNNTKLKLN